MGCRPLIVEIEFKSGMAFSLMRSWQPAVGQPPEKLKQLYADPNFRRVVVEEMKAGVLRRNFNRVEVCDVGKPEMKSLVGQSVAEIARTRGREGQEFETMLDLAIEDDLNISFMQAVFNTNDERLGKLINDPLATIILNGRVVGVWEWNEDDEEVDLLLFDSSIPKSVEKAIHKRAGELASYIRSNLGEVRLQGSDYGPHQMTGIHDLKAFWGKGAQVDVRV